MGRSPVRSNHFNADALPPEEDCEVTAAKAAAGDPEALAKLKAFQKEWTRLVSPKLPAAAERALVRGKGSPESRAYLVRYLRGHRHVRVHAPRPLPRFAPRARRRRSTDAADESWPAISIRRRRI